MSGFSTYLDDKIINHVFKGVAYTPPTKYLALFRQSTGLQNNSGFASFELGSSDGEYTRIALADSSWASSSNGATYNTVELSFPVATTDWGEVTHVGIMDAATGGNCIAWGALANPVTGVAEGRDVEVGDQLIIRANALTVTLA